MGASGPEIEMEGLIERKIGRKGRETAPPEKMNYFHFKVK